jgi:hypothetical protein
MDDDRRAILHVRPEPTLQEVKVPMLFWSSPGGVPDPRWTLGGSRTGEPVDARALVPTLGLLVGLQVPGLDTSLSPYSNGWTRKERRILSSSETIYSEKDLR